jgi:hypothetical protein
MLAGEIKGARKIVISKTKIVGVHSRNEKEFTTEGTEVHRGKRVHTMDTKGFTKEICLTSR